MLRFFYLFIVSSWLCSCPLFSQVAERYVRAGILLQGRDITDVARLGIETDHGLYLPGTLLVADLSESELTQVQQAGFSVKIWIDDLQKDYEARLKESQPRSTPCPVSPKPYATPSHYTYGSMGGYHTLEEMMDVLDAMRARFPHLISARQPLTPAAAHTWEGRRIWYVRLSDNPDTDEPEPEVLYTALHHAREPNSASQMLYFMWYLLENYTADPLVRYIVDHAELYFIPCLNPDGYAFNQATNPIGGGMWRKNRRDNGNGTFGVDLNRNYGHLWGLDNTGSSPTPSAQNYRGPAPFSEPELQALRDFMLEREFAFVQNYHTHGNLLIFPWGYSNLIADPAFAEYGRLFTRENRYKAGTPSQTVGYAVNGVSDDWMHAATGAYAFTPEVGTTGFWPMPSEIEALNRQNVWTNMATALSALSYGEAKDDSPHFLSSLQPSIDIEFTRYGLLEDAFTVSLTPLTPQVKAIYPPQQTLSPALFAKTRLTFQLLLESTTLPGEEVVLLLQVSNSRYTHTDTLRKTYGGIVRTVFSHSASTLAGWSGSWSPTDKRFCSEPAAFTDSPDGNYASNVEIRLVSNTLSLPSHAVNPRLRFCARWQIEPYFDYVQVRALGNGTTLPLCGRYTKIGIGRQPKGEPIFDSEQDAWVQESMDLSALIGQTFRLEFLLKSDDKLELDGFYMDDIAVEYEDLITVAAPEPLPAQPLSLWAMPNPAEEQTRVFWEASTEATETVYLTAQDALGRLVGRWPVGASASGGLTLSTAHWPAGTYLLRLQSPQGTSLPWRLIVLHP